MRPSKGLRRHPWRVSVRSSFRAESAGFSSSASLPFYKVLFFLQVAQAFSCLKHLTRYLTYHKLNLDIQKVTNE
jgi:hypothetical protein